MTKNSKTTYDVYAHVTDILVEMMEKSDLPPWRRTWTVSGPASYLTGKQYRGGNSILLMFIAMFREYKSCFWVGRGEVQAQYKAAEAKGVDFDLRPQIKKGAKSAPLILPGSITVDKEDKKTGEKTKVIIPRFRYTLVFNEDQLLNWPRREVIMLEARTHSTDAQIDAAINSRQQPCKVDFGQFNPCYAPSLDTVFMPPVGQFESTAEYYAALLHEIAHSTGHAKRLDREGITKVDRTDNQKYSQEELVAEVSASILMNHFGMSQDYMTSAAAYLKGWASFLKSNPRAMLSAIQEATRATDFILNIERMYETEEVEAEAA